MRVNKTTLENTQYLTFDELTALFDEDNDCIYDLINNGVDININTHKNESFLMYALKECKNVDIINTILDCGADIHSRNMFNRTPLMICVKNQDCPEIVKLLLKRGSDSNAVDDYGNTALTYSKIYSRSQKIQSLLEKSSKSNCISFDTIKGRDNRF